MHKRGRFLPICRRDSNPRFCQLRCPNTSLLSPLRYSPHTSATSPRTCAQGRFRGVNATHVSVAGPASQQRRVHLRRSPEAVGFPNAIDRVWGPFMGRTLFDSGFIRVSVSPVFSVAGIPGTSVGNDNVCATVEKAKHPARKTLSIPCRTRGYVISGRSARTEFRHDSCNTAPG